MKLSEKMCLKIVLKVTKKTRFHLLFRRYILRKTTGGSNWSPTPHPPAALGLKNFLPPTPFTHINSNLSMYFFLILNKLMDFRQIKRIQKLRHKRTDKRYSFMPPKKQCRSRQALYEVLPNLLILFHNS